MAYPRVMIRQNELSVHNAKFINNSNNYRDDLKGPVPIKGQVV